MKPQKKKRKAIKVYWKQVSEKMKSNPRNFYKTFRPLNANVRHEIFESFCYAIGAYASLRHACFCIRSIEGQTKVNDSIV